MTYLSDFFAACKNKIDNPSKWIKDKDAKDWKDREVYEKSQNAVKFSVLGVMGNVSETTGLFKKDLLPVFKAFREANGIASIMFWQSTPELTYDAVIQAFENAYEKTKGKG